MQLSDFKVGQTVVITGGNIRREYEVTTVEKVGRKYVTVSAYWHSKFYVRRPEDCYLLENSIYGSPAILFPSEESYQKKKKKRNLENLIGRAIRQYGVSKLNTDQLYRLKKILEEGGIKLD